MFTKQLLYGEDEVLKQNPPKQGLKPNGMPFFLFGIVSFKAKSTKTRIETQHFLY